MFPDFIARVDLFTLCLKDIPVSGEVNVASLAALTEGYSGADIHLVCREASMIPMRKLLSNNSPSEIQRLRQIGELGIPEVLMADFESAIANTKSSVGSAKISKFIDWDREFGSK